MKEQQESKFNIGDRIEMTHTVSALGRALSKNVYCSQVMDFDGVRRAKIYMPIFEGKIIPLETGDEYQICFFTKSGLYRCRARIEKRYIEDNIYMMDVFLLSELRKFQRRQYYRLDCMVELKYRILTEEEQKIRQFLSGDAKVSDEEKVKYEGMLDQMPKEWYDGTSADLSGGGVRFRCDRELDRGGGVEILVPLNFQNGRVRTKFFAKVLSCQNVENMYGVYEIRGEFDGITDTQRELVIQYVFEEQRRRMRKE